MTTEQRPIESYLINFEFSRKINFIYITNLKYDKLPNHCFLLVKI